MNLALPYPISANRYWRSFSIKRKGSNAYSSIVTVSDEAKAYKSQVGWIARAAGMRKPSENPMELRLTLCPRRNKDGSASAVVLDLSNCLKVAEDALQGVVYVNDKQVKKVVLEYGDAVPDGALIVEVSEFTSAPAAVTLKPQQPADAMADPF